MEGAAAEDAGGDEDGLRVFRDLDSLHSPLPGGAIHHGVGGGEALPRPGARPPFGAAEIKAVAAAVGDEIDFQRNKNYTLSASEVFALLNDYVAARAAGRQPDCLSVTDTPFGPTGDSPPVADGGVTTDWSQFGRTAADVADFVRKQHRVPGTVLARFNAGFAGGVFAGIGSGRARPGRRQETAGNGRIQADTAGGGEIRLRRRP